MPNGDSKSPVTKPFRIGLIDYLDGRNTPDWADSPFFKVDRLDAVVLSSDDVDSFDAIIIRWSDETRLTPIIRSIRLVSGDIPIITTDLPLSESQTIGLFHAGVNDVLTSEHDDTKVLDNLLFHVENARRRLREQLVEEELRIELSNKTSGLQDALEKLSNAYEETLQALVAGLDAHESAAAGHSKRVAVYSLYLSILAHHPPKIWQAIYRG